MLADIFFESFDALITPTLAAPPALIGAFTGAGDEAENYLKMSAFMPYTPMYNISGLPSISVPLYRTDTGLPIGVMLGGRYGTEGTLYGLAEDLLTAAGVPQQAPLADPARFRSLTGVGNR
jgi:amidase